MSGEWPATQGGIFKRMPTHFAAALISSTAHTQVHAFICACYHVDEVCSAATFLNSVSPEGHKFSLKHVIFTLAHKDLEHNMFWRAQLDFL